LLTPFCAFGAHTVRRTAAASDSAQIGAEPPPVNEIIAFFPGGMRAAASFTSVGMPDTLVCARDGLEAGQPSSAANCRIGMVDHRPAGQPSPSQLPVRRASSMWRSPVRYSKWTGMSDMDSSSPVVIGVSGPLAKRQSGGSGGGLAHPHFRVGDPPACQGNHRHQDVIVEVLANTWEIRQDRNAELREPVAIADPRQQQDLRRFDGAAADDNLRAGGDPPALAALTDLDPSAPASRKSKPRDLSAVDQAQVSPAFQSRIEIGVAMS
jgi:hypothetical protein